VTGRSIVNWIGLVARLYVLCVVAFYAASAAMFVAVAGEASLTRDVLWGIFVLDAAVSIPIALACSLIPVYFAHSTES